jgi:hypothetical protein
MEAEVPAAADPTGVGGTATDSWKSGSANAHGSNTAQTNTFRAMILHCLPPFKDATATEWRLPAITPQALAVQIYMHLANCPRFTVQHTSSADLSPNGKDCVIFVSGVCVCVCV